MTTGCYGTTTDVTGKSFPIRGTPETPVSFNVLGNCESVSVASGATLERQGDEPVTIRGLSVAVSGFGTVDGFDFAASGTLAATGTVSGASSFTIPGSFANCTGLDNIAEGWTLSVNGSQRYAVARVSESGISVSKKGMFITIR